MSCQTFLAEDRTPEPAAKLERAQFLAVAQCFVRKRDNPVKVKIMLWKKESLVYENIHKPAHKIKEYVGKHLNHTR